MVGPWAVRLWTVGGVCLWPVGGVPVGCGRCACRLHCLTCQHCVGRWPVCPSAIAEVLYDAEVDMEAEVPTCNDCSGGGHPPLRQANSAQRRMQGYSQARPQVPVPWLSVVECM